MKEIYKPVPGWKGLYEVSNFGNVLSVRSGKLLTPKKHSKGYHKVHLCNKGKQIYYFIHRLVLQTFKGPFPKDKPYSRHLDGNPTNNHISNLAFGSGADNEKDKRRHGTYYRSHKLASVYT